jgi:hypothetical protein
MVLRSRDRKHITPTPQIRALKPLQSPGAPHDVMHDCPKGMPEPLCVLHRELQESCKAVVSKEFGRFAGTRRTSSHLTRLREIKASNEGLSTTPLLYWLAFICQPSVDWSVRSALLNNILKDVCFGNCNLPCFNFGPPLHGDHVPIASVPVLEPKLKTMWSGRIQA